MPEDPRAKKDKQTQQGGAGGGDRDPSPFADEDDAQWESELAAWDASLPIVTKTPPEPLHVPGRANLARPAGALPEAENSFFETPTTVISRANVALALGDTSAQPPGGFAGAGTSGSGSYAVLVTIDENAPSIFDHDPVPEEAPSLPTDTLGEMAAGPWMQDIGGMISLGPDAPVQPDASYFETFAEIVAGERALEKDRERTVGLCLTAARVAENLGHPREALAHVEAALAADVTPLASPASVAAHRARLGLAERAGRVDDEGAAESLARLALISHPDQTYYRALQAEWMLARAARGVVDGTAAALITAAPEGLPRILAEAEMAWREPIVASAILETAAHRLEASVGAGFLTFAAALNEIAHDFQTAAEQRLAAARLDEKREAVAVGLIRDIARQEPDAALTALEDCVARFPPSSLKVALSRWGAALARRVGDADRAWRFVAEGARLGPLSAGLARDRLDLRRGRGSGSAWESSRWPASAGEIAELLEPVANAWSASVAGACLALRACELADDQNGIVLALQLVEGVSTDDHTAVGFAPAVEALAGRATDAPTRLRALRLWRRIDPARQVQALLDLADTHMGDTEWGHLSPDEPHPAEAVLDEIATIDPDSMAFWRHAALAARRGRFSEAAARIDRGLRVAAWRDCALAGPLGEIAAEMAAREDVVGALSRLDALDDKAGDSVAWRLTLARLLRRLRDGNRFLAYARAEIAMSEDRARGAALLLEATSWEAQTSRPADAAALVFDALDLVPLYPAALGLALYGRADPTALVDRLVAGSSGPGALRWALAAAVAASVSGDYRQAFALALDAHQIANREGADVDLDSARAARLLVRRFAWASSPDERMRIISSIANLDQGAEAYLVVEAAEGEEQAGAAAAAARLFEKALGAPGADRVAADARVGLGRVSPSTSATVLTPDTGSDAGSDDRLGRLEVATRACRWDDVVTRLMDNPPHEETAGVRLLVLAAEIDAGRAGGARSAEIWARVRSAPPLDTGDAPSDDERNGQSDEALLRAADSGQSDARGMGVALEQLADETARMQDERSAALFLVEAAHLAQKGGDGDAQTTATVERRLRAASTHDPTSVPAVMAWRRWLTREGRMDEAADAAAVEAEALVDPDLRVQTLLRAATLLTSRARRESSPPSTGTTVGEEAAGRGHLQRAGDLLRRALQIAPQDHRAFSLLRGLYETAGEHAPLADLLAVRIGATTNPFEVTALRLARAEIFAGPLHDRTLAKAELEAILQKEPQHARALGRLADCEEEDGNDATAADLLIRRASVERSPEKLRELFLRLGRIYTQRVPDPKRAVGAYGRVLQLDANNREALEELARLYLGLGETKNAVTITERLVRIELSPARRADYHVRLGQLAERAGDSRVASLHFKRAVEEAPTDVAAMGELVRYLDKTRDATSRRMILDRAAGELRQAVMADPNDVPSLDALVAVSRWRGRTAVAAAAAELGVLVGAVGRRPGAVLPEWATPPAGGRRLAALSDPSVDERTFAATVPPSVRQLFRTLAPVLGENIRADLSRYGVDRGDRVAPGQTPRDIFDAVAAELTAGPFDLYVRTARLAGSVPLAVEPGRPPAIVVGGALVKLGSHAHRFMAGRTLRLVSTHLDGALSGDEADLGIWLGGIIRQFVGEYHHPDVPLDALVSRAGRVAKLMPKKLRQEVMPFAMESSGELDLGALRMGIRDGANRVGLVASGSLAASLKVLLIAKGEEAGAPSAETIKRHGEVATLLAFALSDEYDELVRSVE